MIRFFPDKQGMQDLVELEQIGQTINTTPLSNNQNSSDAQSNHTHIADTSTQVDES